MGTRSAIGYLTEDGDTVAVYCHWDGYPEHQLPILQKHYTTTDAVKALIEPGSMSCLRTRSTWETKGSPMTNEDGDFVKDAEGNLCYENDRDPQPLYHAERGESREETKPLTSETPLVTWFKEHDCEFLYVWDGKKWIHYAEYWPEGRHFQMTD